MSIEGQMEFNFSEKAEAAQRYHVHASDMDKLQKNEKGEWEIGGLPAEGLLELDESNDNKDMYNIN